MAKKSTAPEKASPFKTVVQNLSFHDFKKEPVLTALYKDTVTLGDEEDTEKTFQANIFVDLKTGEEKYVQNSYSIDKAVKQAKKEYKEAIREVVFEIEFLGKTEVKGKPFNQFKIGYCTETEWEAFQK